MQRIWSVIQEVALMIVAAALWPFAMVLLGFLALYSAYAERKWIAAIGFSVTYGLPMLLLIYLLLTE